MQRHRGAHNSFGASSGDQNEAGVVTTEEPVSGDALSRSLAVSLACGVF